MTTPKLTGVQQRRALRLLVLAIRKLADRIDIADTENISEMAAALVVSEVRTFLESTDAGRAALRGEP